MTGLVFSNDGFIGHGVGRLTSLQADGNILYLWNAIQAKAEQGLSVIAAYVDGNQLTFQLSDHSFLAPVTLPVVGALSGLADVALASPLEIGDGLFFNGTYWANRPASPVQTRTGATWTPALDDIGTYNRFTNSSGCFVTLPDNALVPFPIGAEIRCRQAAAHPVFFDAASPALINPIVGYLNETACEGAVVTLKKVDVDDWDIYGLLAVHP